jgi:hypothetical protein
VSGNGHSRDKDDTLKLSIREKRSESFFIGCPAAIEYTSCGEIEKFILIIALMSHKHFP